MADSMTFIVRAGSRAIVSRYRELPEGFKTPEDCIEVLGDAENPNHLEAMPETHQWKTSGEGVVFEPIPTGFFAGLFS